MDTVSFTELIRRQKVMATMWSVLNTPPLAHFTHHIPAYPKFDPLKTTLLDLDKKEGFKVILGEFNGIGIQVGEDEIEMVANWWLALIIMVVLNGILVWNLFVGLEPISRRAKRWFFVVVNVIGLILAVSQFFWMDF